jgi:hypothetical protein
MNVVVINNEEELTSFPISQTIRLRVDVQLDINDLKNTISLFRITRKDSLVNLASPYNYNLGLIKESYDEVSIEFELIQQTDHVELRITPTKPLQVNSTYLLFVSDKLSEPFITTTKSFSKSNSTVIVSAVNYLSTDQALIDIKILNTTTITTNNYTLQVQIDDLVHNTTETRSINLSKTKTLLIDEVLITFDSPIYVKDELFSIIVEERESIGGNFSQVINTAGDESITPLINQNASTRISNQTVLDFYANNSNPVIQDIQYTITYLDTNVFEVKYPETVDVTSIDIASITVRTKVAFNNYVLKKLKLYDETLKYILNVSKDTYNNSLLFELVLSEDPLQTVDVIVVEQ